MNAKGRKLDFTTFIYIATFDRMMTWHSSIADLVEPMA